MIVEVARDQQLYRIQFSRGKVVEDVVNVGRVQNRRGTTTRFHPDPDIFGPAAHFTAGRIFRMTRAKAYLFGGVELRWSCDESLASDEVPAKAVFHYPDGLKDFMVARIEGETRVVDEIFAGRTGRPAAMARSNGPLPGRWATAACSPIATPCRRPMVAPTKRACAWCSCAG